MPKNTDYNNILIIGAGPIVIGQACEFDYSGAQCCQALMKEGYKVVLINSNPATIMTDPQFAHATYIEPLTTEVIEKIIIEQQIEVILPTMGGQTALNLALQLDDEGILQKHQVKLIGANPASIKMAEDRKEFKQAMFEIGIPTPASAYISSLEQAIEFAEQSDYPIILRPSFTLGGIGGGIAYNQLELEDLTIKGLRASPVGGVLLERSLIGWKEYELEVVRDKNDNCIIICSIENLDPMGVHTGDSITVAPIQTLTDKEYQLMRNWAIAAIQKIGVDTGGANVQFAVNPKTGEQIIIEMNPRVSRSSALASKATGFPIAKVASLLAVGYSLDEIYNDMTGQQIPASFEPAIDYVVVKIPRFAFDKFSGTADILTTQMRSIGEVMSIGRTFNQAMQKGLRALDLGLEGFDEYSGYIQNSASAVKREQIISHISTPTSKRICDIAQAMRLGLSVQEVHQYSHIDPWFLNHIKDIITLEGELSQITDTRQIDDQAMRKLKQAGFSDNKIAQKLGIEPQIITELRRNLGVHPTYKQVDTCAGEFNSVAACYYSSYEQYCELDAPDEKFVVVLGSGANRIGQGIEFDYCCTHGVLALKDAGIKTVMINCNPETVSTDFNIADLLFLEPLHSEEVSEILRRLDLIGIIVQFGGQTPLKLLPEIGRLGFPILGTEPSKIDMVESREQFVNFLQQCNLRCQPSNIAYSQPQAIELASKISYPVLVRPSYVLGGQKMRIIHNQEDLTAYLVTIDHQLFAQGLLLDKFLTDAHEFDVDLICDGEKSLIAGICQHIERAGVHSGDSMCCYPPHDLYPHTTKLIEESSHNICKQLNAVGLVNIQFALQGEDLYVLEVNPRASRTIPFLAKANNVPAARVAALAMVGITLEQQGIDTIKHPKYFSVKEAVFPFSRFPGNDTILGPEMRSTGEVMGISKNKDIAFYLALQAAHTLPTSGRVFLSVNDLDKEKAYKCAKLLEDNDYELCATSNTATYLSQKGIKNIHRINKVTEGHPHIIDEIFNNKIQLVINTEGSNLQSHIDSLSIRQSTIAKSIVYFTSIDAALAFCHATDASRKQELSVTSIQTWHNSI